MLGVSVEKANKLAAEIMTELGQELLPSAIVEVLEKCGSEPYAYLKLTDRERVLASLRYHEFLADAMSEESDQQAYKLAWALRNRHGVDFERLRKEMHELGWH